VVSLEIQRIPRSEAEEDVPAIEGVDVAEYFLAVEGVDGAKGIECVLDAIQRHLDQMIDYSRAGAKADASFRFPRSIAWTNGPRSSFRRVPCREAR
jgi:hypothetical protein